jgi:glycosyltransferase involved in cell wall biosynthesis
VTANFRGAREIVRHGEDGWAVPCADAPGLAEGIRKVLSNPTLMASLAERGHGRVQRDFSRDAILDRYLALYRELAR